MSRKSKAKKIEKMLNEFREQINKEAGCEVMPYKAKVKFIEEDKEVKNE